MSWQYIYIDSLWDISHKPCMGAKTMKYSIQLNMICIGAQNTKYYIRLIYIGFFKGICFIKVTEELLTFPNGNSA